MLPKPEAVTIRKEDDLRWVMAGTDYLLEVDADTPAKQNQVAALRRRLTERIRKAAGRLPRSR
jgi:hypothetical protein